MLIYTNLVVVRLRFIIIAGLWIRIVVGYIQTAYADVTRGGDVWNRFCVRMAKLCSVFSKIWMQKQPIARPTTSRIFVDAALEEINHVGIL